MRTAVYVALCALLLAAALRATRPAPPDVEVDVLAFALPGRVVVEERVSPRAAAFVSADRAFDRRLHVCDEGGRACRPSGWGNVEANGLWTGITGHLRAPDVGSYLVEWTVYGDWGVDTRRAVARVGEVVEAVAREP